MNYYKDNNNIVYAYSEDQLDHPVVVEKLSSLTAITETEADVITNPPLTPEQSVQEENEKAKAFLASTDWYDIRSINGKPTPADILVKRQDARDSIVEVL